MKESKLTPVHIMRFGVNGKYKKRPRRLTRRFPSRAFGRMCDTQAYVKLYCKMNNLVYCCPINGH